MDAFDQGFEEAAESIELPQGKGFITVEGVSNAQSEELQETDCILSFECLMVYC